MNTIEHISKAKLHYLRKLTQKKYRQEERKFLVEGMLVIEEAINAKWNVEYLLATLNFLEDAASKKLIALMTKYQIPLYEMLDKELRELTDVVTSQGVIAVVSQEKQTIKDIQKKKKNLIVALDRITNPGNLGTLIRTCDWFGVDGILISDNSVELFAPKVIRATMGSLFHFPIVPDVELTEVLEFLRKSGYSIIACSANAKESISNIQRFDNQIFIFGSEAHGIRPEVLALADEEVSIPKYGKAESLNVAIACGVALAEVKR